MDLVEGQTARMSTQTGEPIGFLWPFAYRQVVFLCVWYELFGCDAVSRSLNMSDILYLVLGVGGFVVCLGFVQLCDRL